MLIIPLVALDLLGMAPDAEHDVRISTDPDGTTHVERVPRSAPPTPAEADPAFPVDVEAPHGS